MARKPRSRVNAEHRAFSRILVGVDGSASSKKAARKAITLSKNCGARLTVVSVAPQQQIVMVPTPSAGPTPNVTPMPIAADLQKAVREASQEWVDEVASFAKHRHLKATAEVLSGEASVAETIEDYAKKKGVDLIVVGARDTGSLKRLILGSVSSALVNNSSIPVLVVR